MDQKAQNGKLLILFSISLFLCFSLLAQNKYIGNFVGIESGRELKVSPDGSYYLLNGSQKKNLYHLDTLSFGSWESNTGFIVLNSSISIESQCLKIRVDEKVLPEKDSLIIEINNPYEDYYKKVGGKRLFEYNFYHCCPTKVGFK